MPGCHAFRRRASAPICVAMHAAPKPEFSLVLDVARVTSVGLAMVVEPDAAACARIARRLGIPAVVRLRVDFTLEAGFAGAVDATGTLDATVVRECAVTAVPFEAVVTERFALRFVPGEASDEIDDPDAIDEIPFDGRTIDLGDSAVEQLARNLEPFPRAPDVENDIGGGNDADVAGTGRPNPFAVLDRLRDK